MPAVVVKCRRDWMSWEETESWFTTVDVIVCLMGTTRYLYYSGQAEPEVFQIGPTGVIVDL